MDIGQSESSPAIGEGQAFVIEAEEVEDGGLKVVDVDRVFDRVHGEGIRCAVGQAGLDTAAGHPDGEGVGMVVASPTRTVAEVALDEGRAAEFTTPDHQGVLQ